MSIEMKLYAMKMHSAMQYENLAFAAKPYSIALYGYIDSLAKQDKKHADMLYNLALGLDCKNFIEPVQVYMFDVNDAADREPIDVAKDVVAQIAENEKYISEVMKDGFNPLSDISFYRFGELKRIAKFIEDESIFGQGPAGSWWRCNVCGHRYMEKQPDRYAKEECPVCLAKQASFIRVHEIGGWQ